MTSDMMWRDFTPHDWLNKGYSYYMAAVVIIGSGRDLTIEVCRSN